jgi:hypothetical protein
MILMREKTATVTIPLKSKTDFVKLNAGQEVPMRVHYSEEMLTRLSKAVESKVRLEKIDAHTSTTSYILVALPSLDVLYYHALTFFPITSLLKTIALSQLVLRN